MRLQANWSSSLGVVLSDPQRGPSEPSIASLGFPGEIPVEPTPTKVWSASTLTPPIRDPSFDQDWLVQTPSPSRQLPPSREDTGRKSAGSGIAQEVRGKTTVKEGTDGEISEEDINEDTTGGSIRSPNGSVIDNSPAETPATNEHPSSAPTNEADTSTRADDLPPQTTVTMVSNSGPAATPDNRTLVITLSTVLSAVALFLIIATVFACFRVKHGRLPFVIRGITPIDDEEIESWKRRDEDEKFTASPARQPSTAASSPRSLKKSPSVIVYHTQTHPGGPDDSAGSIYNSRQSHSHSHSHSRPRSLSHSLSFSHAQHAHSLSAASGKRSLDMPPPAVLARAPNSRPGLTDETVEGDDAFIPTHRRQPSRLSKRHARSRSRASLQWAGPASPRMSVDDAPPRTPCSFERSWDPAAETRGRHGHARIYSDSSVPPRSSFDAEFGYVGPAVLSGGMATPESEIGRAIG